MVKMEKPGPDLSPCLEKSKETKGKKKTKSRETTVFKTGHQMVNDSDP